MKIWNTLKSHEFVQFQSEFRSPSNPSTLRDTLMDSSRILPRSQLGDAVQYQTLHRDSPKHGSPAIACAVAAHDFAIAQCTILVYNGQHLYYTEKVQPARAKANESTNEP